MWRVWWETSGGKIAGVAAGLLFGIIYLISGFWDMLFCALLIGIGYWIGKLKDERRGPLFPWEKVTDWVADRWPWSR
ncbi:DUF2273 domain-containing protein [Cohnella luojiensis]|uniref:DUF2273 domain-containing protein n=1 Tax=Cohnella luojiensis TaxID=652876 RepID=A0A4Y8M345_9BACL|nr:DUF2273 domain-containing protein [Cohnella luojiensis]TFE29897.1 DUF2273 domain-containing protein [Cohnella luojiensis]